MPNHKGSEGSVYIASDLIAEVRDWSMSQSADTIEDTIMGETARTFKPGLTGWEGSISCWWDETDTNGQQALTVGAEVVINLYPEGNTSGDTYFTGSAIVTSIERSAALDGMVEVSFSYQGNGALSESTVV